MNAIFEAIRTTRESRIEGPDLVVSYELFLLDLEAAESPLLEAAVAKLFGRRKVPRKKKKYCRKTQYSHTLLEMFRR